MSQSPGSSRVRHRWTLGLTALALLLSALGATAASAEINYQPAGSPIAPVTDPTQLQPPPVTVLRSSRHLADGSIFIAPKTAPGGTISGQQGPEIFDNEGRPIWFQPIAAPYSATDFRVQRYRGQPVLTYDVGQSTGGPGHSEGWNVILDRHYNQIATVQAGNGLAADQHEFALTPQGTALITIYHQVPYDLSSVGGPANGSVLDGIVQEVDVASGKVLFEWHSLDHVPLSDSYQPLPSSAATPYDYFHINSVNLDSDGNLLISARHTWTVYDVDRHSGDVLWRLGGKESDFQLGPGVQFSWQHNALPEAGQPNTIRIFDNHSNGAAGSPASRIIDVRLDQKAHTATLVSSVQHPDGLSAGSQGNAQRLPGGHLFVGWGQLGRFSEFDAAGNLVWDGQVPAGYDTYRAYRSPWVGEPDTDPTAVAERSAGPGNRVKVEAIWNGATEVQRWLVLSGRRPDHLRPAGSAAWDGLDTQISVHTRDPYVEVVALDDRGRPIGRSQAVSVSD
ncbi:MAG TPA: arylsulfotransferase family protein [Solirubrobacterales bacterium]|nr:arylsulfotransferase family protein [Solirubrobacterales bacterium]